MEDLRNRKILAGKTSRHIKSLKNLQLKQENPRKVCLLHVRYVVKLKNGDLQKQDNS